MNISDSYIYKLRFYCSRPHHIKWMGLKEKCENGFNKDITDTMKLYCKLEKNRKLPHLDRSEGGLGGSNNRIFKQIRFRYNLKGNIKDNTIMFDKIYNSSVNEWTYEELDDIMYAFTKTANDYLQGEYVTGVIEMVRKNLF